MSNFTVDEVTGKPVLSEYESKRRSQYIIGLERLVDFYKAHPDFPAPWSQLEIVLYPDNKAELQALVRAAGSLEKKDSKENDWLRLEKDFSDEVGLRISIYKGSTCERVVVGKEVIKAQIARYIPSQEEKEVDKFEWECDGSIFAPEKKKVETNETT